MSYIPPIKTTSRDVMAVARAAFPEWRGRKLRVSTNIPASLDSYWDGGSRDFYAFVELSTLKAVEVHSNHPYFEANRPRKLDALPPGVAIVRHTIFCGKDIGCEVIVNPCDLTPALMEATHA